MVTRKRPCEQQQVSIVKNTNRKRSNNPAFGSNVFTGALFIIFALYSFFVQPLSAEEIDYTYDDAYRLIQTNYQGIATVDYAFDGMNNRLVRTITSGNAQANRPPDNIAALNPADGAQNVLSGTALTWSCGDPDSGDQLVFRIHLGTMNPPRLMKIQRDSTSFTPPPLPAYTTFYWQVTATDSRNGVYAGPIWKFTTGNNPPNAAELLKPSDKGQADYLNTGLTWQNQGDPNPGDEVMFDLYLGTTAQPQLFKTDLSNPSFKFNALTRGLDATAVYYWQVMTRDNHGASTLSAVRSFTFRDSDSDRLPDDFENTLCTSAVDSDTDNDGILDGFEDKNRNGMVDAGETNPCNPDTDGDGMADGWEIGYGLDPLKNNDHLADKDQDGFDNITEFYANSDPSDDTLIPGSARIEDFESGDFTKFFWMTDADNGWKVTSKNPYAGAYAARSGAIEDDQTSTLETTVFCEEGQISFFYRISSEQTDDRLVFYIDDEQKGEWSGNTSFNRVQFPVTAGWHDFKWVYIKGSSGSVGLDSAWLDDIVFPGVPDTDGDGVIDGWEMVYFGTLDQDLCEDSDGDGVSDLKAALFLVNPIGGDKDQDGMPDSWEIENGLKSDQNDSWDDPDGDGFDNYDEFIGGSDPNDGDNTPYNVLEDFETNSLTKFFWILSGDGDWRVTRSNAYKGFYAARSPALGDEQSASIETTINCVQGVVAFHYAVSTEADGDYLRFYIDDQLYGEWSGEQAYTHAIYQVMPGLHTFRWEYAKNGSENGFNDTVWLDHISFPGSSDSDGDGVIDGWEMTYFDTLAQNLCDDSNGDGLSDLEAAMLLLDPIQGDNDGDGMTDHFEVTHELDIEANDGWEDPDSDGYANYDEFIGGSDPNDGDSTPYNVLEDFETNSLTKFYWVLSGDGDWRITRSNAYKGFYAAQAPVLDDEQSATIETTINCIQGFVAFRYSVSSETDGDHLRFFIDGELQQQWSGDQPYQFISFPVGPGIHTFKWEYVKNGSLSELDDSAWVDNISFPGSSDSDGDGVIDGWEMTYFDTLAQNLCDDSNGDGLSDLEAAMLLLDPIQGDNDGDGMTDHFEVTHELDIEANDGWEDPDSDGYANYDEFIGGSDPNDGDSTPYNVLEDFETNSLTKFYWVLSGDGDWRITRSNAYKGFYAAQAPVLDDEQSATIETTIKCIQGFVAFRYSVSSETAGDYLRFFIDGELQQQWSGDQPYQFASFPVVPGIHTFKWEYVKNGSLSELEDSAWVDNISFPGSSDTDNDGVVDGWELTFFGSLDQDLCNDTDGDGLSDLEAALSMADPIGGTGGEGNGDNTDPIGYTITAHADDNGSISPEGDTIVNSGESLSFQILPDADFIVDQVVVDGVSMGAISAYTFDNIDSDHTIEVSFVQRPEDGDTGNQGTLLEPLALYEFRAGSGDTVYDMSGNGAALNLTIADPSAVQWIEDGGLQIDSATIVSSATPAGKIIDAVTASKEITVEAWIKPANTVQDGPARIVTLSADAYYRNFTLGQGLWGDQPADLYDIRLRTSDTGTNGTPSFSSPAGSLTTALTHVVFTRDSAGNVQLYLNGTQAADGTITGDFAGWQAYPLSLGNEMGGGRPWLGVFYMLAFYDNAMDAAKIARCNELGPDRYVKDTDGDGIADALDAFPYDHTKWVDGGDDDTGDNAEPLTYTIAVTVDDNGSIFPEGDTIVNSGESLSFQILPDADFIVDQVVVDGVSMGAISDYPFDNINSDHTIEVFFAQRPEEGDVGNQVTLLEPLALYDFRAGSGDTVYDMSGNGAALNLTIADPSAVQWLEGGGLQIDSATILSSTAPAGKIIDAVTASEEITVEAWIKPANTVQDGPARIVTLSADAYYRNFTLGQGLWGDQPTDLYDIRLRTSDTGTNGTPSFSSPEGSLTTALTHVVYTRDSAGNVQLYLNGTQAADGTITGDLAGWQAYPLSLGNEMGGGRPWLGTFYKLTLYDKVMGAAQIKYYYELGSDR